MEDDVSATITRHNHGNLFGNWEVVSASIAVCHYIQSHRCIWNVSSSEEETALFFSRSVNAARKHLPEIGQSTMKLDLEATIQYLDHMSSGRKWNTGRYALSVTLYLKILMISAWAEFKAIPDADVNLDFYHLVQRCAKSVVIMQGRTRSSPICPATTS
jgi:hypothetical protein